jgi:ubiquinone/menaquinone biosynthesis C-methylase UbiE
MTMAALTSEKSSLPASTRVEEERIQRVYAERARSARPYSWFDADHLFIVQQLERRMLRLLRRHTLESLQSKTILEVGCGNGYWLREFIKWGARPENLMGVDLLNDRLAQARRLSPVRVTFKGGNAARLDVPAESFDIVLQATVFTSMRDRALKRQVAAEMLRLLKPNGVVLWYDFHVDNPRNPDVRGIKRREIKQLFPGCRIALEKITLAPPVVRRLAPYSRLGCYMLSAVPWLCTHYLGTIQKSASLAQKPKYD